VKAETIDHAARSLPPREAKAAVLHLLGEIGFDPVDSGDWTMPGDSSSMPACSRDLQVMARRRALAEADRIPLAE